MALCKKLAQNACSPKYKSTGAAQTIAFHDRTGRLAFAHPANRHDIVKITSQRIFLVEKDDRERLKKGLN